MHDRNTSESGVKQEQFPVNKNIMNINGL